MRPIVVLVSSYFAQLCVLVVAFKTLERGTWLAGLAWLAILALLLGGLAGASGWATFRVKTVAMTSAIAALTVSMPPIIVTFGFALALFGPAIALWAGANVAGFLLVERLRTRFCSRVTG